MPDSSEEIPAPNWVALREDDGRAYMLNRVVGDDGDVDGMLQGLGRRVINGGVVRVLGHAFERGSDLDFVKEQTEVVVGRGGRHVAAVLPARRQGPGPRALGPCWTENDPALC